jgi:hypothetical protein
MNRIWDALKAVKLFRARAINQKKQVKRRDQRATRRVLVNVPLFVYGSNFDRQPFHEEVFTLDLNEGGCLISMKAEVAHGQRLWITNTENEAEREFRVIHMSRRIQGRASVGVGFLQSGPRFWDNVLL